jgi:hypothetical protein
MPLLSTVQPPVLRSPTGRSPSSSAPEFGRIAGTCPGREEMMAAWVEWRRRCALGLCADSTARDLSNFAGYRFSRFLRRVRGLTPGRSAADVSAREAWHRFETHLLVTRTQAGKRYKDWLFARIEGSDDEPLDVVQGGATLILRDVVRAFVREEGCDAHTVSLHDRVAGRDDLTLSIEDLLACDADPRETAAQREYEDLAVRHASELFGGIPRRLRILLAARERGIPLTHPVVSQLTNCRKSVANDALRTCLRQVFDSLKLKYQDEDHEAVVRLALLTAQELARMACEWGKPVRRLARLFSLAPGAQGSMS